VQIRKTLEALSQELQKNRPTLEKYNLLIRKYDEAESASYLATEHTKQSIATEFKRRGDEFEEYERELFASNWKITDLDKKLADQRAFFVQTELLKFRKRGYAHNPKVLANATAGLPDIGCRHSYRICSKTESPLWPSHHFKVFEFVQHTWDRREPNSRPNIVDLFRAEIGVLPRTVRIEQDVALRFKFGNQSSPYP
jgi:hypothetical protein